MRKLILFLVMSTVVLLQLEAQKGKVSGLIEDEASGEEIPFATVALYPEGQSTPYKGSVTDNRGKFLLDELALGQYRLHISFIGYETDSSRLLNISQESPVVDLGSMALRVLSIDLDEA